MFEDATLMEDLEDMEDFENYEDFEDMEDFEEYEDFEDMEDFEEYEDYEDMEGDPFLGKALLGAARRIPWRKLARTGAQALGSIGSSESDLLGEMAYMAELAAESESELEADQFLGAIGNIASSLLGGVLGESSSDYEADPFLGSILGGLLGESNGEGWYGEREDMEDMEGDPFLPALLPLAAKFLPMAMPLIRKGIRGLGRALRETDASKQSVKVLPIVAAKSVASLAKQANAGKKLTPKRINATIVSQAKKTLSSPVQVKKAIKQNRAMAKRAVVQSKQGVKVTQQALRKARLQRAQ